MERDLRRTLVDGEFEGLTPERSRIMRAVRGHKNRSTELRLRSAMVRAKLVGWRVRPTKMTGNPDFVFVDEMLAVFVDGCFWHGCPQCFRPPKSNTAFWIAKIERNRRKDRRAARALRAEGYNVVRFWEHELRSDLAGCIRKVRRAVARSAKRRRETREAAPPP